MDRILLRGGSFNGRVVNVADVNSAILTIKWPDKPDQIYKATDEVEDGYPVWLFEETPSPWCECMQCGQRFKYDHPRHAHTDDVGISNRPRCLHVSCALEFWGYANGRQELSTLSK